MSRFLINSVCYDVEIRRVLDFDEEIIEQLKDWIDHHPQLPNLSKNELILFCNPNSFDLSESKDRIEQYFSIRKEMPALFNFRDITTLNSILDCISVIALDEKTPEGCYVILAKLVKSNPNLYNFKEALLYFYMVLHRKIYEHGTEGEIMYIYDLADVTLDHLAKFDQEDLSNFFNYSNCIAPMKWKGIYYVNSGNPNEALKNGILKHIVQAFEKAFYRDINDLDLPREMLPNEMGGQAGPLLELHKRQIDKIGNCAEWFSGIEERFAM